MRTGALRTGRLRTGGRLAGRGGSRVGTRAELATASGAARLVRGGVADADGCWTWAACRLNGTPCPSVRTLIARPCVELGSVGAAASAGSGWAAARRSGAGAPSGGSGVPPDGVGCAAFGTGVPAPEVSPAAGHC